MTAPLVGTVSGGEDLPRLEVSRLRSTWLAEQAGRFGISVLLQVAGLKRSSRLGDLVSSSAELDEAVIVALLRGGPGRCAAVTGPG